MSEASFASLNPALLARKGGAKPAMRPQLHALPESLDADDIDTESLEDLGWNDMGADREATTAHSGDVLHLTPASPDDEADEPEVETEASLLTPASRPETKSPVKLAAIEQDESIAEVPTSWPQRNPAKKSASGKRRAAFTLRLDTDRHLKLRLAATMQGKSAQAVVTDALDTMFAQIHDFDALIQRMKHTSSPTGIKQPPVEFERG